MKRRKKEELGTFSASAIDLFASALGAFIIISVLLFPYVPNLSPDPLKAIIEKLNAELTGTKADLETAEEENEQLTDQNSSLQSTVSDQASTIQSQQQDIASAQAAASAASAAASDKDKQLAELEGMLDGTAFLGIEPKHKRFQLLFDMSGSIGPDPDDPINDPGYIDQVKKIADTILSRLGEQDSLRIITYQGDISSPRIQSWPSGGGYIEGVSGSSKNSASGFLDTALENTGGYTPTFEALNNAIAESQATTIIIVTDGVPQVLSSDGPDGAAQSTIIDAVQLATLQNGGRHEINIIAMGNFINNSEQATAIIPLATENGGALVALP